MDDRKRALLCQTIDRMNILSHNEYIQSSKQIPRSSRKKNRQQETVCDVCDELIKSSIRYPTYLTNGVTPVCCTIMWNQKVCPSHLLDGTMVCCSCMRLKTRINDSYINLSDGGRVICSDCYSTAILDARQCEPLIRNVEEFFKTMNLEIREEIRVFLVEIKEMTRLVGEELNLGEPVFGLRLTDGDVVTSSVTNCARRGTDIVPTQRPQRYCGGFRIAILFGLPWVMTGAILAHEMMHLWFELEGIGGEELDGKVAEGMCQVMGFKWLEWFQSNDGEIASSSTDEDARQFQRNLIETYKFVTKMHGSYEYGEGFRDAQWAVEKFGLHKTLDHISATKKLPGKEP